MKEYVIIAGTEFDTNTKSGQYALQIEDQICELVWSNNKPKVGDFIYLMYLIEKLREATDEIEPEVEI